MMVAVEPSLYRKYVNYSVKGVPMLYIRLSKALYVMMREALMLYKRLRSDLESMGFEVNPYDPCMANKIVNVHQMTACWHVDDLKVFPKDEDAVTAFTLKLAKLYEPNNMISQGRVQEYLGMDIN